MVLALHCALQLTSHAKQELFTSLLVPYALTACQNALAPQLVAMTPADHAVTPAGSDPPFCTHGVPGHG